MSDYKLSRSLFRLGESQSIRAESEYAPGLGEIGAIRASTDGSYMAESNNNHGLLDI